MSKQADNPQSKLQGIVEDAIKFDKKEIKKFESVEYFREELLTFITNQASLVDGDNKIIAQIKEELSAKIELHELDVGELLAVLRSVSECGNKRLDSMFRLFMPNQNSSSSLLPPPQTDDEDDDESNLTSEERRMFHKFYMFFQEAGNRQEDE